jgi:tRNA(Ile)-lysidine synthase
MKRRVIDRLEGTVAAALSDLPEGSSIPHILIALSGGADSVALTHVLFRLRERRKGRRYELTAGHLNHGLREVESDRDERFVRELCERLQIGLVAERADLQPASPNLEERARELRYEFLNRTANRLGAGLIAVAHHADDQAETVMLRLLRGSGAAGLGAMAARAPGRIVRPLLGVRRVEIIEYLDAIGATYVTDSSNITRTILRNRVRLDLIPMLEREYAPRLSRRLAGLAGELRALDDYISAEARRELRRRLLDPDRLLLAGFADLHPALGAATVREWLRERRGNLRRVGREEIDRIVRTMAGRAAGTPGSIVRLTGGSRLRWEYDSVVFEAASAAPLPPSPVELNLDGITEVAGFTFVAHRLRPADVRLGWKGEGSDARPLEALFDADLLGGRLVVRGFCIGDRVRPLGMSGSRKVQDVFVDRKLPRKRRATWPIVSMRSEVLWIPGMVRSRLALVTEGTSKLLQLLAKPRANSGDASLLRI